MAPAFKTISWRQQHGGSRVKTALMATEKTPKSSHYRSVEQLTRFKG